MKLALVIIGTVFLGIRILFGWLCRALKDKMLEENDTDVSPYAKLGVVDIYVLVTLWILYCSIG